MLFLYLVFLTKVSYGLVLNNGGVPVSLSPSDYRKCMDNNELKLNTFEVLPIYGWDNLRNKYEGMVIASNYSQCKMTIDGKYLIPDDVYLIPQRESRIHQYAELITHWHNYSSVTSKSINVDAGIKFSSFGISGKYSNDYMNSKSKQVMDKSVMTRVQLRYTGYVAKLQPNANLHPNFKQSLHSIGTNIQLNRTNEARYLSEMVVRDFGTHFVNTITAGAALVQEDFVTRELVLKNEENKRSILASASANFFGVVHASASTKTTTDKKMQDSYDKSKTSSYITAYGGSMYTFQNYSVNKWAEKLNDNLVAMDRAGDPLHFLITPESLPELPASITMQIREFVFEAIRRYYEYNLHRGCMDTNSGNFAFQANVDDGSCKPPVSNLTFGGVFQSCTMSRSEAGDLCGNLNQPNPKTGKYSCPQNYQAVHLYSENYEKSVPYRSCHHCGWWSRCCRSGTRYSFATLKVMWCVATKPVPRNSGYLFGGLFTPHVDNPVTMDKSCPAEYSTRMIGSQLKVCISDDYELGTPGSLEFGGFFSCKSGNPLADKNQNPKLNNEDMKAPLLTLREYYRQNGGYSGPKACPQGYSQHLAIISQECSIYYCILSGALNSKGLPPVRRPPFTDQTKFVPQIEEFFVYKLNSSSWDIQSEDEYMIKSAQTSPDEEISSPKPSQLSTGSVVTISVCITLVCVGVMYLASVLFRKRKANRNPCPERSLSQEEPIMASNTYGSTTNEAAVTN